MKKSRIYPSVKDMTGETHAGVVREIFSTVTDRYDFLNHLLSMRRDVAWRGRMIRAMQLPAAGRLLDIATGTADVAIGAAHHFPDALVVGVDPSAEMLEVGQKKILKSGLDDRIQLVRGDALELPFRHCIFDAAAIAFGMRNITEHRRALMEMNRVLRPGGRVLVLEMGLPQAGVFRRFYRFYLEKILPRMAALFASNPSAYEYLSDSIINFPGPEEFRSVMELAGFRSIRIEELSFGVTRLFAGVKRAISP